jgi:hypothetical protein
MATTAPAGQRGPGLIPLGANTIRQAGRGIKTIRIVQTA